MALRRFCQETIILDALTRSKKANTKIPNASFPVNIGSFQAQTQVVDSRPVTREEDNQEGRIDTWMIVLLKDDVDANTNFDYNLVQTYRVTLPNGKYAKVTGVDINTSPSVAIQNSVILTVEQYIAT